MVCIAAFIILAIVSVPVLALSVIGRYNKKVAKLVAPYFKMFKKSWYCVGKRATLQKCESTFKDEIKNSILKKVIVRRPKWVKPLSITIEVVAVLIVLVTVWSLLTAVKSGLSLYVYGTCNVSNPSGCVLGESEFCAVEDDSTKGFWAGIGAWFTEWGTLASDIPARIQHWEAKDYVPETADYYNKYDANKPVALEIFDPGCFVCRSSFIAQKTSGFFDRYNVALLPYTIPGNNNGYRFKNSGVVARYIVAAHYKPLKGQAHPTSWLIMEKIFTGYNDKDQNWQDVFNSDETYDSAKVEETLASWLLEFGYSDADVVEIKDLAASSQVASVIKNNKKVAEEQVRVKMIPTTLYDGKRHSGLFKR
ncbi:MAG: hypothetical protein LBH36_02940 [Candidatus Nomurabacteria bacterium]|jgi:hypothetical protein|nr:hypothetical protein [Candidatus Nomurabacteria bacterium]